MSGGADLARVVRQWTEKAESDFRNATHTLTLEEDCPFDTVCFHAQQCAEKYLKALLVSAGVDFPRTHDLRVLIELLPENMGLGLEMRDVLPLNRYAVETRYPGEWEPIDRKEAEAAVEIAGRVRDEARKLLKLP